MYSSEQNSYGYGSFNAYSDRIIFKIEDDKVQCFFINDFDFYVFYFSFIFCELPYFSLARKTK
ncbi:hypothetical protein LEP1GSC133_2422 [Leptospira borgpetersenii serovar Pomona str. 200901868]|uniref:Uncharacterized protein n=1 Tax=Leptospira borgpetersenii serovar Pomona str. 200901868 TaxID=1192866 RepID=M6VYN9_LEPBO|nr:hypothetical protein LEP1GSC133_2422 [Leptospira borgpetersenii serovar Pomona str. 200901868]